MERTAPDLLVNALSYNCSNGPIGCALLLPDVEIEKNVKRHLLINQWKDLH